MKWLCTNNPSCTKIRLCLKRLRHVRGLQRPDHRLAIPPTAIWRTGDCDAADWFPPVLDLFVNCFCEVKRLAFCFDHVVFQVLHNHPFPAYRSSARPAHAAIVPGAADGHADGAQLLQRPPISAGCLCGTSVFRNRVPNNVWLSGVCRGVIYRSFFGVSAKRFEFLSRTPASRGRLWIGSEVRETLHWSVRVIGGPSSAGIDWVNVRAPSPR
jgi:hypothetical protein